MSKLNENQLLDLSTIIYLSFVENYKYITVGMYIDAYLEDNSILEFSKHNGKYPNGMSVEEWDSYLRNLKKDTTLMSLTINNRIDKDSGERMAVLSTWVHLKGFKHLMN